MLKPFKSTGGSGLEQQVVGCCELRGLGGWSKEGWLSLHDTLLEGSQDKPQRRHDGKGMLPKWSRFCFRSHAGELLKIGLC